MVFAPLASSGSGSYGPVIPGRAAASDLKVLGMKTLRAVIDGRAKLNAQERDSLHALLSTRCGARTKEKLRIRIDLLGPASSNYGIYRRIVFRNDRAEYTAGQCWIGERRLLRRLIME